MKLLFWGNQITEKNKTGVGWYNYNLIKEIDDKVNYFISLHKQVSNNLKEEFYFDKIKYQTMVNEKLFRILPLPYHKFFPKADIYYFDGFFPLWCKGKKVAIVHDLMSVYYPENYRLLRKISLKLYFLLVSKRADKIIVVSENTKKDLIEHYSISEKRIEVIYPGVDLEKFSKIGEDISNDKIRMRYNIPGEYFLYVGALRKNKNIDGIIRAYKSYLDYDDSKFLVIAGSKTGEYKTLKKLVLELQIENRVIFTGYFSEGDKKNLYKGACAFLMPSHYEGFGIPVIEAMASSLPVITSNISSLKEISEGCALQVNPSEVLDIRDAMIKISSDEKLKKSLIENGLENSKEFTWTNTGNKFIELLSSLFEGE